MWFRYLLVCLKLTSRKASLSRSLVTRGLSVLRHFSHEKFDFELIGRPVDKIKIVSCGIFCTRVCPSLCVCRREERKKRRENITYPRVESCLRLDISEGACRRSFVPSRALTFIVTDATTHEYTFERDRERTRNESGNYLVGNSLAVIMHY